MHDPDVVAFTIRRPWPRHYRSNLRGKRRYWPAVITVWHREPGGADSGDVCKHHRSVQKPDGQWEHKYLRGWRWHFWHWHIQISPLQMLRRWALTRCAWCDGRSTKRNRIDVGHSWHPRKRHWWQGESDMFHGGCSAADSLSRNCVCDEPLLVDGPYGPAAYSKCLFCGGTFRDKIGWETNRRAVALAGAPVKGQMWHWPDGLTYADVEAELDSQQGDRT